MTVFKRSVLQNNGDVDTAKFELVEVELTPPPPGHIQVKISKAGCAFADTAIRMGQYPGAAKPKMTLGYDLVGTVTALGEGVSGFAEGDRVVALTVPASCAAIPDEKIVAMVLNYVTAYQMLFRVAKLSKESTDQVNAPGH
ncbi:chaperonin 10-like protein [Baffinella frigidus]|nr:chaperonin 10-like protein [Cryptophyta sp. CCMP2293]